MSALVRQAVGSISTAATTMAAAMTASTAGNLLVAIFSNAGGATNHITAVSDSSSTAWTEATDGSTSGVTNTRTAMWYRANCPAGITSVTATQTSSIGHWSVSEWSGIATASVVDVASPVDSTVASGTSITTPAVTTTVTDLVLTWWHHSTTTVSTPPSGIWTPMTDATDASAMTKIAYALDQAAGSYSATWAGLGAAKNPGAGTVGFKSALAVANSRQIAFVNQSINRSAVR